MLKLLKFIFQVTVILVIVTTCYTKGEKGCKTTRVKGSDESGEGG